MTVIRLCPWSENPRNCSARGRAGTRSARSCCGSTSSASRCTAGTLDAEGALQKLSTITLDRDVGAVAPAEAGRLRRSLAGLGYLQITTDGTVRELAQPRRRPTPRRA